jgi:hypothetical protein
MKRVIIIAFVTLLSVASCELEISPSVNHQALVFTASVDKPVTKTSLDGDDLSGYTVNWSNGDEITIVDGAAHVGVYSTTSTTNSGTFTQSGGDEVTTADYEAYYPASIYNGGIPTLPDVQRYTPGNIAEAPMYASSSTTDLQFKNLCGILRLNISTSMASQKVRSIGLFANQKLSGTFSVESDAAVISSSLDKDNYVSLDCGEEGVNISSTPTSFYFSLPPGDYTNLQIGLYTTEGLTQIKFLKSDKTVVIERSAITDISLSYNSLAVVNLASPSPWSSTPNNFWFGPLSYVKLTGSNSDHVVRVGHNSTVLLDNATLKRLYSFGDMTVVLSGNNTIAIEDGKPFYVADAYPGNITIRGDKLATLLSQTGGRSTYSMGSAGTLDVLIEGGRITAQQCYSEQISTGLYARSLTVTGGKFKADAGWSSKDLHPGVQVSGDILITGGIVYAEGKNGLNAGGNITITGGNVTAWGRNNEYNTGDYTGITALGDVLISGGTILAKGGPGSPAIGIRNRAESCGNITITGGTVTAIGATEGTGVAAGIGTGSYASGVCGNITIGPKITRVLVRKGPSTDAVEPVGLGVSTSTVGLVSFDPSLNMDVSTVNVSNDTWTFTPSEDQGIPNETGDYDYHDLDED